MKYDYEYAQAQIESTLTRKLKAQKSIILLAFIKSEGKIRLPDGKSHMNYLV